MIRVLILFYSRDGNTRRMANQIARGVSSVNHCEPLLRTVEHDDSSESAGPVIIDKPTLRDADALILGSPTRFGNMAGPLKSFLDSTSDLWLSGAMVDKPAAVFTSTSSLHGGQESTLLTMMLPLIHHGMIMVGLPYTEPALSRTSTGGAPYGATHVSGGQANNPLSTDEKTLCTKLGHRVATIASRLTT